jgi:hypothetical protein
VLKNRLQSPSLRAEVFERREAERFAAAIQKPERSNPLPKTKSAKTKHRRNPTVLATGYHGYRQGIASLRKSNSASLI